MGAQVTLQRLELLTVFQTDDVVGRDGLTDGNGRLQLFGRSWNVVALESAQCAMHFSNQSRQITRADSIMANISSNDFGAEFDQICINIYERAGIVVSFFNLPNFSY